MKHTKNKNIMKRKTVITAIISTLLIGGIANAQNTHPDHIWKLDLNQKEHTIGLYGGLTGSYFELSGNNAGLLSYQLGFVVNQKYGFGLAGSGLAYDQPLNNVVTDGSYHVNSGWTGGYIERIFTLAPRLKTSLMWQSGRGVFFYRYDREYRTDKIWYEEIIDGDTYFVNKPTIKAHFRIAGNWWVGAEAAFTLASPVDVISTDEYLMRGLNYGISLSYGIF